MSRVLVLRMSIAYSCFTSLALKGAGLRLAARHPDLVRSLVLLAPSADPQPRLDVLRYRIMQRLAGRVGIAPLAGRLMKTLFGRTFLQDPDRNAEREEWQSRLGSQSLEGVLRAVDGVLARSAIRDVLSRIEVPTLVMRGDEDVATPRVHAQRVAHGIAGSQFVSLGGVGHTSTVERPEEVARLISDFLAGLEVLTGSDPT